MIADSAIQDAAEIDAITYEQAAREFTALKHSGGECFRQWMLRYNASHPEKPIRRPKRGHVCRADVHRALIKLACENRGAAE